jgi:hypothetical protein
VLPGEEDFGMVLIEANASGRSVIALQLEARLKQLWTVWADRIPLRMLGLESVRQDGELSLRTYGAPFLAAVSALCGFI